MRCEKFICLECQDDRHEGNCEIEKVLSNIREMNTRACPKCASQA